MRIFNDRGQMKVRARLTESMKPGVVNCYQGGWDTIRVKHYIEGHPNNLTHQIAKPAQSLIPNFPSNAAYYDGLVQVEQQERDRHGCKQDQRPAPRHGDRHEPLRRLLDVRRRLQGDQQRAARLSGGTGSSRPPRTSRRRPRRPRATTSTSRAATYPNLELAYLPVACQHCNDAPCVKVCPVQATFRRDDGTVLIDYNRCIGCRYCMAACPYGVRIFNWGDADYAPGGVVGYGKEYRTGGRLVFTPERPKGVVEKCTFCVERIDVGELPFCVEACPIGARVFGDLNDPDSAR